MSDFDYCKGMVFKWLSGFLITLSILSSSGFSESCLCGLESGTLIVSGGGGTRMEGHPIYENFLKILGGKDQPIVVFPTSQNLPEVINDSEWTHVFDSLGFTNVTVMHTLDTAKANSEAFVKPLLTAKCVFFQGGRAYHYVNSYAGTRTVLEIKNLLKRGGVVIGSSAGAEIQSSTLSRGMPGNGANHMVVSLLPKYNRGFGLLPNSVFDAHVDVRERWAHLYEPVRLDTNIIGYGVPESTAIFFQKNVMQVVGSNRVAVSMWENTKGCTLADSCYQKFNPGEFFDVCTRKKVDHITALRPDVKEKDFMTLLKPGLIAIRKDLVKRDAEFSLYALNGERLYHKTFDEDSKNTIRHRVKYKGVITATLKTKNAIYQQKILLLDQ